MSIAAPYSKYLSNFRTTRPSRNKRTTFKALKRLPIPWKKKEFNQFLFWETWKHVSPFVRRHPMSARNENCQLFLFNFSAVFCLKFPVLQSYKSSIFKTLLRRVSSSKSEGKYLRKDMKAAEKPGNRKKIVKVCVRFYCYFCVCHHYYMAIMLQQTWQYEEDLISHSRTCMFPHILHT